MADLTIVAGEVGRGGGVYDTGLFTLPDGLARGVETVADVVLHGGVEDKTTMLQQVVAGLKGSAVLKGGVALAQTVDPTNSLAVAASAVSVGLDALDGSRAQRALIEVRFLDGATFVATAEAGLAALIENDRRVVVLAAPRVQAVPTVTAQDQVGASVGAMLATAASGVAGGAGAAVAETWSFLKKRTIG